MIAAPPGEHDRRGQERDVIARHAGGDARSCCEPCSSLVVWLAASVERIARPSEPPTCWEVLNRPEASPESSSLDAAGGQQRDRDEHQAHTDAHRHEADEQIADVVAVDRQLGQDQHSQRGQRQPDDRDVADADPPDQLLGQPGADDDPAVTGRNARPAFSGL